MTPALGLTVDHPDKADPDYTLFAPMTDTSAYLIAWCWGGNPCLPTWYHTSKVASRAQSTKATSGGLLPGDHRGAPCRLGMARL